MGDDDVFGPGAHGNTSSTSPPPSPPPAHGMWVQAETLNCLALGMSLWLSCTVLSGNIFAGERLAGELTNRDFQCTALTYARIPGHYCHILPRQVCVQP